MIAADATTWPDVAMGLGIMFLVFAFLSFMVWLASRD